FIVFLVSWVRQWQWSVVSERLVGPHFRFFAVMTCIPVPKLEICATLDGDWDCAFLMPYRL
ncbi:MAG TPA: hypothetical protein VFE01_06010, partial [Terracidiphilus sp.]|nr:hypothetical protein [Terracidiphilus sp.]